MRRGLLLPPVVGAAIGGAAILVSDRGVAERPALSALVLAAAGAAGLAPLRYGLPVALVLACFEGFMVDFAGDPALLWNEVFIALLVARSLWQRRPTRVEGLVTAAFAALFLGYLAAGTKPLAVFWGAKVLLTSAVAAWAIARMRGLGRREWLAAYYGLATAVAASVVLAAWQRHEGLAALLERGIPSDRARHLEGALRAFAGFSRGSPFAYTLALALLCWLALAVSKRERAVALWTGWLPVAAVLGLVWAHNRLAPLALGTAVLVVGARETFPYRSWLAAGALAAGGAALVLAFLHWSGSPSATFRTTLWTEYLHELSPFGAGPASAGSAHRRANFRPWVPPLAWGPEWGFPDPVDHSLVAEARGAATLFVGAGDALRRPPLTLNAAVASRPERPLLVIRFESRALFRGRLPTDRFRWIRVRVPPGVDAARLELEASRPAAAIILRAPRVVGFPRERAPTLRVQHRMWDRSVNLQRGLPEFEAGLVDNQYISWLFQYGLFGGILCVLWLGILAVPLARRAEPGSLALAGGLSAAFLAAAAVGVNVWEESPTEFVAAVVLGLTFAANAGSASTGGAGGAQLAGWPG